MIGMIHAAPSRAYAFNGSPSRTADSFGLVTTFNATTAVPEPGSLLLFASGLLGLSAIWRRSRRAS